ncbi:MAG: LamG-like jellyroll fold domain-containing protein, partial [Verrucomicrobiales bacterium]
IDKARIFVNGVDETSATSTVAGPHRPNTAQPLEIGSRFGGTIPFNGTIDDVAFYNYQLTAEQIEDHFSIAYVVSSIVTQPPANVTGTEASTITITANVAGFPNTYQWFKDGVALEQQYNLDGTVHFPTATVGGKPSQGVNGPSLVIAQAHTADNGSYKLVVTNPLGGTETTSVTVNVTPDLTAPQIQTVSGSATQTRVTVKFNKPMLIDTTGTAANYTLSGGASVEGVSVFTNDTSVVSLVTSALTPGTEYTLTVTGVKDSRASENLIGTATATFKSYAMKQGALAWDYFPNIPGTAVDNLLFSEGYPGNVYTDRTLTNFSTMSVTTAGNLNNNPEFGPLGDNYGARVYGWITPTTSGNYQFFIRSDDASQLSISTDADPANLGFPIASETGCCGPFEEITETNPDPAETSDFIALEAGKAYFVEAIYKEGGGGDHLEVAWRKEGDSTPAGTLPPIPGTFLSAYAPVAVAEAQFNQPVKADNGEITFTWTGSGVLEESTDLETWSPVAGNPASGFKVTPTGDSMKFYRLKQ